jgi:hypothetical protein
MLVLFYVLLFLLSACLLLLMPMLWARQIYTHYRGSRAVTCPETHRTVAVSFDAWHAAITGLSRKTDLRLASCTRWPERADCGQDCIPEARETALYKQGEAPPPSAKQIYHLPVLMAASAAWVLGMVWHSEYLFRGRWAEALNLSPSQVRQVAEWLSPHVLSVLVPLLFAYGVAWLLALNRKQGVVWGIITAIFLWAALILASLAGTEMPDMPRDLLWIEAAYSFLATVAVGAIIGGLSGKLVGARLIEK